MAHETLQQFVEAVNGTSRLRIEEDFGGGFVRLMTSEAERRQAAQDIRSSEDIVLELLRNARDAHASHVFVAMSREGDKRLLTVLDDGDGIPASMHERVFEPRVTSKLDTSHADAWGYHGRGMALYSIAENAEDASIADSAPGSGTAVHVRSDTRTLPERTDQSTFPTFEVGEPGKINVRGPRNLLRTICEFALDCRSTCTVYAGSPAEICAALYAYGMATLSTIDRLFCADPQTLPLSKRFAAAGDATSLAAMAASCGLDISERTARRVMNDEVDAAQPVIERIVIVDPSAKRGKANRGKARTRIDNRSVKLAEDDKALIAEAVRSAFGEVADRHYLKPDVAPAIVVREGVLHISVPLIQAT